MAHIVLDPGHGGRDPGAVGYGMQEKEIALHVALMAADILRRHNVRVTLTRDSDTTLEPAARVRRVNAAGGDAVVSIHCNAAGTASARGTETYHSIFSKPGKGGAALAAAVHSRVVAALGTTNRGVKTKKGRGGRDYYYMIRETRPPAIIVELAFITNAEDAHILKVRQPQAAEAIARGVLDYFGITYQPPAPPKSPPPEPTPDVFPDVDSKYRDMLRQLRDAGIVAGYPDGTFRPGQPVTRLEAAIMLYRLWRARGESQ